MVDRLSPGLLWVLAGLSSTANLKWNFTFEISWKKGLFIDEIDAESKGQKVARESAVTWNEIKKCPSTQLWGWLANQDLIWNCMFCEGEFDGFSYDVNFQDYNM